MSERHVPLLPADPTARPHANGSGSAHGLPWEAFFAALPRDAQADLLARTRTDRLTPAELPAPSGAHLVARFLCTDPDRLPEFDPAPLADPRRPPTVLRALSAALGCPDLFLADAGPLQNTFAADLAAEVGHLGERVLVLTPTPADADAVISRLGEDSRVLVGRALAPDENPARLPAPSAGRTARAHGEEAVEEARARVTDALREAEARSAAARGSATKLDELRRIVARVAELDAEADRLRREREALPARVAEELSADPALAAELARLDADATKARDDRDAKQKAVEALRQQHAAAKAAPKKSGVVAAVLGWFHKPDAAAQDTDLDVKLCEAEAAYHEAAALADRLALERAHVERVQREDREQRAEAEVAALLPASDAAVAGVTAERAAQCDAFRAVCAALAGSGVAAPDAPTAESVERLAAELPAAAASADTALAAVRRFAADLASPSPELVRVFLSHVRAVVGTPAALGDPLAAGEFDRVILTDADRYTEADLPAVAAARWVLVGDAFGPARGRHQPFPPRPSRNGQARHAPPARPSAFRALWRHLHRPAWADDGRLVAILIPDAPDPLCREPLADRPDVELRFAKPHGAEPVLAEVAFPAGTSVAVAKAFLAREVGEVRPVPCGPVLWHESADRLTACWPAAGPRSAPAWPSVSRRPGPMPACASAA